ncbi:porin [Photobacterium damselae subsp. damselae]|uniref:porin n=1 Tax=Photobacterium damselae TaxID=38293 RepID=UPI001EED4FAD|nr:porin [Photobacterium damselae]UJZ93239.1 porin [Photobacterium damselae subsp. damselae]UJZ97222.1 porin [Photobacterium damselae subsp. damselae]
MENMFKRTLLGAAIALVSTSAMAEGSDYQVGINSDFNVDVYGVAAMSVFYQEDGATYDWENESRIGFRASKAMFDNVEAFMQIESGYVGDDGEAGKLGARDTFLGLRGDWGSVRFGRMLTPMYEIIDWPYSNPGLGRVFDWGGDVKFNRDRHGNTLRYDSAQLGNFNFSVATGVGDTSVDDNYWYGASAHLKVAEMITFHAALETENNREISAKVDAKDGYWTYNADGTQKEWVKPVAAVAGSYADTFGYIVGFEASLPAGFGLAAAYKSGYSDIIGGDKSEQDSYSIIGQYWRGAWGFKLGYAANLDSKTAGVKQDDSEEVISGQLMYVHNGFVPYLRVGQHDAYNATDKSYFVRLGLEYGF